MECSSGKAFIEEWLLVTIITFIMINRQFKHLANGNFYRGFWGIAGTIWIQKYLDYKKSLVLMLSIFSSLITFWGPSILLTFLLDKELRIALLWHKRNFALSASDMTQNAYDFERVFCSEGLPSLKALETLIK